VKKRWMAIPAGCLALAFILMGSSWLGLRLAEREFLSTPRTSLSWADAIGRHQAGGPEPVGVSVLPPLKSFLAPEVLSVEDAVESKGEWVILDGKGGKIHLLHPTTGVVESMGREGPGPGELQDPLLISVQDTVLWVVNQRGYSLDRFLLDSGFQDRHVIRGGACLVGLAKALVSFTHDEPGLLLRLCPSTIPGPGTMVVERLSREGTLLPLISLPLGEPGSRRVRMERQPAMAAGQGSIFLGTWDAPCVAEFGSETELPVPRCLPNYSRPATSQKEKAQVEARFQGVGKLGLLPLEVPDQLPWFDGIFQTGPGLVVRRIRGPDERDLILLPSSGPASVTNLRFPPGTFVGEETILVVEDRMEGTWIRIYSNPWKGK
jgi:hypothetical protein